MPNPFTEALASTLKYEGEGEVKEPTGDISVKGIRQNVYNAWAKQKGLPQKNVKDLTDKEIMSFVYDEFYKRPKIDQLPQEIIKPVFDFGFNSGPETAIQQLQTMVGSKADGIIGDNTISAVNQYMQKHGVDKTINDYLNARQGYVSSLTNINKYQKGLKNRIDSQRR